VLNADRLTGSGQSAALIRRAAIITPLWYWSKLCSESEFEDWLSACSMIGGGGGKGGKL
jgi:hypothetical protein